MAQSLMDETAKQKRRWVPREQMSADEAERHKQRNKGRWDERVAISHMIPGYRALYKQTGITKLQVRIGRTKDYRLTPEQEHKERIEGVPDKQKKKTRNSMKKR